ncbi:MAG TPA: hypothetical protein VMX94_06850 [Armatimonadota bacterium]|nr:hypothetical protein [Armatimonadota bacterium]
MFTGWLIRPGAPQWIWAVGVLCDFLIFGGAVFLLLQLVPVHYRKALVAIVTFLAGLIYSVEFFVPGDPKTGKNFLTGFIEQVADATNVVYAFALGLGVYSLFRFHGKNLARKRQGWHNNLAFFVAFFVMMLAGFWQDLTPSSAMSKNTFNMLFDGTVAALGAAMFSIVGFFIVSAAYRAFRIRSAEATLMLAAAFVVMLGQVPIGAYITNGLPAAGLGSLFRLENVSYWILNEPNMAAWRAIAFGIEVGALAMALRTWLSLERGSFFEREL